MCTVLLPPGDNPIAVNKYFISYHFICFSVRISFFHKYTVFHPLSFIHDVMLQHVYPHIYLYENEETLTTCIKYMEDFTGVRVKDLKKRSFKVSYIHLILHVCSCCSTLSSDSVESCRWVAEFQKNLHLPCLRSQCVV